jgi:hypothetical protein
MSERRRVRSDKCTMGRMVSRRVQSIAVVLTPSPLMLRPNETTPTVVLSGSVRGDMGGVRRRRR